MSNTDLSPVRIAKARHLIDPVFMNSALRTSPAIDRHLGLSLWLKDETENPIRSFKGRGTSLFVASDLGGPTTLVAASAGNFGQGLAYAAAKAGHRVIVFAAETASPLKIDAMRKFGAEVILHGQDLDAAKARAKTFAAERSFRFVEDGAEPAIAEGAGTIAMEITDALPEIDAVFIPLGNGALASGMGCWLRHRSPRTRIVAVAAEGAPCMAHSFTAGRPMETPSVDTIADGIAVRVPVPFAVESLKETVDEVALVSDRAILEAMRLIRQHLGRVVEPAGAAGLAGLLTRRREHAGSRVATVLCGANLTPQQITAWLPD
ncbi:threonine ammonia-lyase [Microvirga mediterraneensis]|uniref:Pyridoxal-phosphate dependent enzyme n=1 Tax=Microvirga mediterraneensis TaxID=2754695 RepID=A0A838BSA9_9HYPH|nr:pyridoxal-phosphate dependent enzyme [Microvirga mediterraneensis]MBA1158210.1 pyridoxal-phosphate dependent enzyme [Microvirga mediterraneensis]